MKQRIFKGLLAGLATNLVGISLCILIISQLNGHEFLATLKGFWNNEAFWMIIALGALPNLLLFFALLKRNKEYEARGVIMATFIAAISTYILYFTA